MCAINGITGSDERLVEAMNRVTKSRGPDGSRVLATNSFTFGHNRLSIIDLSDRSSQPMVIGDGRLTIVFNGEIYNYRELREELRSHHTFVSDGDTEVLLAGYSAWGTDVLNRLRGIFAFAIWDKEKQELFAARDHMGVKPFYYTQREGKLIFSSELKGVLEGMSTRKLDTEAFSFYFSIQYVPSPYTLVEGVKKLPPAYFLRFKEGRVETGRYWKPSGESDLEVRESDVYDALDTAVGRQLVSDRPLGVFLSGGIDSSIVLHHASKHSREVKTYSVAFEMVRGFEYEAEKFNADAMLARQTASHFNASHTQFDISLQDIRDAIRDVFAQMDEPVANPTSISQYLLSKWVRDDIVVALGGDGGDELFGGYPRHQIALAAYYMQKLPKVAQTLIATLHSRAGKLSTPMGTPLHKQLMFLKRDKTEGVLSIPIDEEAQTHFFETLYAEYRGEHPVTAFMKVDRFTWLADEGLLRLDKASMAHGLEVRVPMLDLDVVELSDKIPVTKKFSPFTSKKILRRVYREHLPANIFTQPKRGWISPGAKWLRDPEILTFAKHVLSTEYYDGLKSIIDFPSAQRMLDNHVHRRGYHLLPLWNLIQLQVWARVYKVRV